MTEQASECQSFSALFWKDLGDEINAAFGSEGGPTSASALTGALDAKGYFLGELAGPLAEIATRNVNAFMGTFAAIATAMLGGTDSTGTAYKSIASAAAGGAIDLSTNVIVADLTAAGIATTAATPILAAMAGFAVGALAAAATAAAIDAYRDYELQPCTEAKPASRQWPANLL